MRHTICHLWRGTDMNIHHCGHYGSHAFNWAVIQRWSAPWSPGASATSGCPRQTPDGSSSGTSATSLQMWLALRALVFALPKYDQVGPNYGPNGRVLERDNLGGSNASKHIATATTVYVLLYLGQ